MSKVQQTIDELRSRCRSLKCAEVCKALKGLGFDVRSGDGPGHKVVSHPQLAGFHGTNFNCGHGKNDVVSVAYVINIARVLENWKTEIEAVNDD
jgi:hypothetical protein